jgi:hypothetical protein
VIGPAVVCMVAWDIGAPRSGCEAGTKSGQSGSQMAKVLNDLRWELLL